MTRLPVRRPCLLLCLMISTAPVSLLCVGLTQDSFAYQLPDHAPKLALYDIKPASLITADSYFSPEEQAIAAKYDVITSSCDDGEAAVCKANNPRVIMLMGNTFGSVFPIEPPMPQWAFDDTTYSLEYRLQYYTKKNFEQGVDWRYKRADGSLLPPVWGKQELNWTQFCPLGVFGASAGKTVEQFVEEYVWPQMMQADLFRNNWDGYIFDTFPTADCWNPVYDGLDYNYDGVEDDCYLLMYEEEAILSEHPWTMEKLNATERFFSSVVDSAPDRFPLLYGQDALFTPVASRFSGWKIESWLTQPGSAQRGSKWLCFWAGIWNTTGYREAEMKFARFGPPEDAAVDSLQGWDMTILQMALENTWSDEKKHQMARFGLGTALLGDGFFAVCEKGDGTTHARYYEFPEMWEWNFALPALTEVFTVSDPQVLTASLFCRRYADAVTGAERTVVVDTLRQDAYPASEGAASIDPSHPGRGLLTEEMAAATADLSVSPNPSGSESAVRLSLGSARAEARVEVFDVAGRVVQRLYAGPLAAGVHGFRWDGRDERGERCPAGLYFVRVQAGGLSAGTRVVRLE